MSVITINPESAKRAYLQQGGEYGNGRVLGGEVELLKISVPSEKGPGWDYDCEKDTYCEFLFKVTHEVFGQVLVTDHQPMSAGSGSKALQYLHALAPELVDLDTGSFDPEQFINLPCAIEVRDPVESKKNGNWYTGNVTNVMGSQ